jgi:small subunit ribosomal protein S20
MANLKSSKKDAKKSRLRARSNSAYLSSMKTAVKKFMAAVSSGDESVARDLLREAFSRVGKAEKKGVVKKNAAARRMGNLSRALAGMTASTSA